MAGDVVEGVEGVQADQMRELLLSTTAGARVHREVGEKRGVGLPIEGGRLGLAAIAIAPAADKPGWWYVEPRGSASDYSVLRPLLLCALQLWCCGGATYSAYRACLKARQEAGGGGGAHLGGGAARSSLLLNVPATAKYSFEGGWGGK